MVEIENSLGKKQGGNPTKQKKNRIRWVEPRRIPQRNRRKIEFVGWKRGEYPNETEEK